MDLFGIDLSKLTEANINPMNPELFMNKILSTDVFNQPKITRTFLPSNDAFDGSGSETSWMSELKNTLLDVWEKPTLQMISASIAITGVVVCSWRLSQYWKFDDSVTRPIKVKSQLQKVEPPNLKRSRTLSSTSVKVTWPADKVGSCQKAAINHKCVQLLGGSFDDNFDGKEFHNRLGKVIGRVRDLVRDLQDLDTKRKTLQGEITLQQASCLRLQELGELEKSKRQAAEDKVKMIETENHRLKQLNEITAKKASLIDRLEFIIQEKNAIEKLDTMSTVGWTPIGNRPSIPNHVSAIRPLDLTDMTCHVHPFVKQEEKTQLSGSSLTDRGDKSSSVIVLSENGPESLERKTSSRRLSLSPTTRSPTFGLENMTSPTKSLPYLERQIQSHIVLKRSRSENGSDPWGLGTSFRRSACLQQCAHENPRPIKYEKLDDLRTVQEEKILMGRVDKRRSTSATNLHTAQNIVLGKMLYNFETRISPPKYLRRPRSQDSSCSSELIMVLTDSGDEICHQTSHDVKRGDRRQAEDPSEKRKDVASLHEKVACVDCTKLPHVPGQISHEDHISTQHSGEQSDTHATNDEPLNLTKKLSSVTDSGMKISFGDALRPEQITSPIIPQNVCQIVEETISQEPPTTEHEPVFPGIINVFRRKKATPNKKLEQPKKEIYQVVKFVNKISKEAESCEKEDACSDDKKSDDAWVVLVNCEK